MFTKEERSALAKTLQDTILENVPGAVEQRVSSDTLAYRTGGMDELNAFCLLHIAQDHLELHFRVWPDAAANNTSFETVEGTDGCRLIVRKRTDLPGEILNAAIREAAGVA